MKRLHVNVAVADLAESIRFYSALFGGGPTVEKPDYAKWMLDDPRVNFAISSRGAAPGVDHLGIQAETNAEMAEVTDRLRAAQAMLQPQTGARCCYAIGDKAWTEDPQGLRWENFVTHGEITEYGRDARPASDTRSAACCAPPTGASHA